MTMGVFFHSSHNEGVTIILKNQSDNCTYYISTAKMMQCKHHISINRTFDKSNIGKHCYQRKEILQSSNYGPYLSPKMYTFDSCLDNNEDNFEIFDINNNNDTKHWCIFDENLVNFDQ